MTPRRRAADRLAGWAFLAGLNTVWMLHAAARQSWPWALFDGAMMLATGWAALLAHREVSS